MRELPREALDPLARGTAADSRAAPANRLATLVSGRNGLIASWCDRKTSRSPCRGPGRGCRRFRRSPGAGRPQCRDPPHGHALLAAGVQRGRVAAACQLPAQADSVLVRPASYAAQGLARPAGRPDDQARGLLGLQRAAGNLSGLLPRRQPLPSSRPGRAVPGHRLAARTLALRTLRELRAQLRTVPARRIWRARATWSSPTTWSAGTTRCRRRTASPARGKNCGSSGRSACSCGIASAWSTTWRRCRTWTPDGSASRALPEAPRKRSCWRRSTTASGIRRRSTWSPSRCRGGSRCENAPLLRIDTNNVEFAAAFAPKPQLLVSATGDWTGERAHVRVSGRPAGVRAAGRGLERGMAAVRFPSQLPPGQPGSGVRLLRQPHSGRHRRGGVCGTQHAPGPN